MLPESSRIVYDDAQGQWRVLFAGKFVRQVFKTNEQAYAFLQDLNRKKTQPEYEK